MDVEQAWMAGLEDDLDEPEPEEEPEYWEDDELTPEELTAWQDAMQAAEQADRARGCPGLAASDLGGACQPASASAPAPDGSGRQGEGSVPDLIGAVLEAAGDPALLSDGDLLRSLAGWHAVAARSAARELRATEELLRRRRPRIWDRRADRAESRREDLDGAAGEPAGSAPAEPVVPGAAGPERVMPAVVVSREAVGEVAMALTATEYSAQAQVELAADLSRRLPGAFGELDAGRVDLHRVRVLAEGTQFLSDTDAGKADALLAPRMGQWTSGDLKDKVRKAVIGIDPAAADRRANRAARRARFAVYANEDQTATAAVERMPAHLGAAVKARVNAIARAAKAAGMTGPLPLLEAKVATGLLLDTLPDIPPPQDGGPGGGGAGDGSPSDGPGDPGPAAGPWDDGWPAGWFPAPPATAGTGTSGHDDAPGPDFTGDDPRGPGDAGTDNDPDGDDPNGDASDRDAFDVGDRDVDDRDREDRDRPDFTPPDPAGEETEPVNFTPPDPGTSAGDVHPGGEMSWPPIPGPAGRDGPGCHGLPGWLQPKNPGRIRLTVPWRTLTGLGPEPGELSWTGPITPAAARDLAAAAAADPSCTWRLIITDDDGHATAITTLRTRRNTGASPPGLVSEVTVTIQQTLAAGLGRDGQTRDWIAAALARSAGGTVNFTGLPDTRTGDGRADLGNLASLASLAELLARAIPAANRAAADAAAQAAADMAAGGCAHTRQAPGYRVPDTLRRWLNTRDRTCRNPICRQPALHCDQDHTLAYDRGGRTCTCNMGGLCRLHHQLKQLPGWKLTQDAHGYFTWTTPAGLTYRKEPYRYPV